VDILQSTGGPVRGDCAGVRPWRRMISASLTRSGGPPVAALITAADSRKYCGPIAAGVIAQRALASGCRHCRTGERHRAEYRGPALVRRRSVCRQQSRSAPRRFRRSSLRSDRGCARAPAGAARPGPKPRRGHGGAGVVSCDQEAHAERPKSDGLLGGIDASVGRLRCHGKSA
jgi:hypothetical protein